MPYIELTQGKRTLVDDEDCEWLSQWKWYTVLTGGGYYATRSEYPHGPKNPPRQLRMARFIMNAPSGLVVDHNNHDTLDNRRSNLRVCTLSQNSQNQRKQARLTTSRHKGVSWHPGNFWQAYIKKDQSRLHIGTFSNEEDAALAYNQAALALFGEYSCLNEIEVSYAK